MERLWSPAGATSGNRWQMHEPQEGRKQAKTIATQLRLLFKRVTELAARDRIELALLATADHATVQRLLEHVTRRRIEFAARLFQRLGVSGAKAKRRALLAYSAYLGHAQLVHATPTTPAADTGGQTGLYQRRPSRPDLPTKPFRRLCMSRASAGRAGPSRRMSGFDLLPAGVDSSGRLFLYCDPPRSDAPRAGVR